MCKTNNFEDISISKGAYRALPKLNRGYGGIKKILTQESRFWPVQKESRCEYLLN